MGKPPPPVVPSVVPSQRVPAQDVESTDDGGLHSSAAQDPDAFQDGGGWARTTQHRHGGAVRVYLGRPWFVTGADESLGVILAGPQDSLQLPPNTGPDIWAYDASDTFSQFYSQMGQDPIRRSQPVSALGQQHFRNVAHQRFIQQLPDALVTNPGAVPEVSARAGPGLRAAVRGVDGSLVRRHPARRRRVLLVPFLRLAVCRFQPNSLTDDVSISRVSTVDIIQLLPDRRLTLLRHQQDPEITVTLWGRSYLESDHDLAPLVTAQVFSAEPGGQPDETHWQPVPALPAFELRRDDGRRLWTAEAQLPPATAGRALRLLVVEREQLASQGGPSARGSSTWAPSTCEVYSPAISALTSGGISSDPIGKVSPGTRPAICSIFCCTRSSVRLA